MYKRFVNEWKNGGMYCEMNGWNGCWIWMKMALRRAWRLRGFTGIWPIRKGSGMGRNLKKEELEFWLDLGCRALSVSWRSAVGQPTCPLRSTDSQPSSVGSTSESVFCDRESSVSRRPTDMLNVGRPTANRGEFGSISRMVIFCQEIWWSAVG